jgi:hypothetical protein
MRIAAHLGVLDEVELIGVEHVIVFDMGSRDGTLEVIERLVGPSLDLVRLRNDTPWEELKRRTIESVRAAPADWVLFQDADEFWLPASGSLRHCASLAGKDIVTVNRFNVVATESGPAFAMPPVPQAYSRILLYSQPIPGFQRYLELHPEVPWIRGVPAPKVISRREYVASVTMGSHDVDSADRCVARRAAASDLVIAHLPVSGRERFRRRIANIGEFLRLNPGYLRGAEAWHWKRFHEISVREGTEQEYRRQLIDRARLCSLAAAGTVRTAAQLLPTADPQPAGRAATG